jgi:hypothetical protein
MKQTRNQVLIRLRSGYKPIHKLNNGIGATLCNECSVIISTGITDDLFCDSCIDKIQEKLKDEDKE